MKSGSVAPTFMKKTALVLSAGGPCGISCIKALRKATDIFIVAADRSKYAAGLQMADVGIVMPGPSEEGYVEAVEHIIDQYKVDILMPSFESGVPKLAAAGIMDRFGLDSKAALLCQDKLAFVEECRRLGLPVPETELLRPDYHGSFPRYIKPRVGSTSIDHYPVHTEEQLKAVLSLIDTSKNFLNQEFMEGEHWNVDVLADKDGFVAAVPRRDVSLICGQSTIVEIRDYQPLIAFAKEVQEKLGISSPFHIEAFETEPEQFKMNEINVRFPGGVIFSVLAGPDIVSCFATKDRKFLNPIKGGFYTRYFEEVLIDDGKLLKE